MNRHLTISVAIASIVVLLATGCSATNGDESSEDSDALATELIDKYALAVFTRDQESLGDLLSDAYLLRRSDGTGFTREGYVNALAQGSDYELVDYTITNVTAQQDGDILVATFTLEGEIIEDGRSVISEPSPSLVTFVRVDGQWKLASDAFFN